MLEDAFNDFIDCRADLNVVIEEVTLTVIAGLGIIKDVGEEDDFKLVEMKSLGDMQ